MTGVSFASQQRYQEAAAHRARRARRIRAGDVLVGVGAERRQASASVDVLILPITRAAASTVHQALQ